MGLYGISVNSWKITQSKIYSWYLAAHSYFREANQSFYTYVHDLS